MKTAVIIDYKKINKLKEKIGKKDYIDHAVDQLAYELSMIFG
jgi:hypothetical protein